MRKDFQTVQLRREIYEKADQMRNELSSLNAGRNVSMTEVVTRALNCLQDAHRRQAWLSPAEALPLLERRVIDLLAATAGQVASITAANPGAKLIRCETHAADRKMMLVFDTGEAELKGLPVFLPESLFGALPGERVQ